MPTTAARRRARARCRGRRQKTETYSLRSPPVADFFSSRKPSPTARPTSGSLPGPKTMRTIKRTTTRCQGCRAPSIGVVLTFQLVEPRAVGTWKWSRGAPYAIRPRSTSGKMRILSARLRGCRTAQTPLERQEGSPAPYVTGRSQPLATRARLRVAWPHASGSPRAAARARVARRMVPSLATWQPGVVDRR